MTSSTPPKAARNRDTRMVRDYATKAYTPAARRSGLREDVRPIGSANAKVRPPLNRGFNSWAG